MNDEENNTAMSNGDSNDLIQAREEDADHFSRVTKASYPIREPLARILQCAMSSESNANANANYECVKDSYKDAISNLISNAFQALDAMYFQTASSRRNQASFAHRLCIRIHLFGNELSITDYGCGMTRADLINILGVGGTSISHRSAKAAFILKKQQQQTNDIITNDDDDDDIFTEDEEDDTVSYIPQGQTRPQGQQPLSPSILSPKSGKLMVGCTSKDIGSFYAALCSLGTKVNVGTKSKFDEYYEFEVNWSSNNYEQFTITRPLDEGVQPSFETKRYGDSFHHVRGESGTRVTITLFESLLPALSEEAIKAILHTIFETSQYRYAFSTDDDSLLSSLKQQELAELKLNDDTNKNSEHDDMDDDNAELSEETYQYYEQHEQHHLSVKERSKYIPIRLSLGERKMLRLVESTMNCCNYTSQVDDQKGFKNPARRTHAMLKGITSALRGIVTSCDYAAGQKLLKDGNYQEYEDFFRSMFEIARRHKIMNPEKMRTEYGKLIYLLQDTVSPQVAQSNLLGFSTVQEISTVYRFLEKRGGLALLDDPLIETATQEVLAENKKSRAKIQAEIKQKEKAVALLKQKYSRTSQLSTEDIHLCLYSICDNNSFLNSNRVPIDKIISYLTKFFAPDNIQEGYSLSIVSGKDGARLSHSHERQYYFALQSLTLWRDIINDMFRLWAMAEEDLLSDAVTYALQDTGQGTQRVQQSPKTYKAMQRILSRVQNQLMVNSKWIGSSVIHMGDHNVPNALSFIDKYTQVPRILCPIVTCLENLERICEEDDGIKEYVKMTYGGLEKLKKDILCDFFRSAFDGSGADNFYDAGSCIDGRLTSAWNWCSQLSTKPYYPIFKLTGFIGFDGGDFK